MPAWMTSLLRELMPLPGDSSCSRTNTSPYRLTCMAMLRPITPAPTIVISTSYTHCIYRVFHGEKIMIIGHSKKSILATIPKNVCQRRIKLSINKYSAYPRTDRGEISPPIPEQDGGSRRTVPLHVSINTASFFGASHIPRGPICMFSIRLGSWKDKGNMGLTRSDQLDNEPSRWALSSIGRATGS